MMRLDNLVSYGLGTGFLSNGFFSYVFSEIYEKGPIVLTTMVEVLEHNFEHVVQPIFTQYSHYILLVMTMVFLTSSMQYTTNQITISKKGLLKLAAESRIDDQLLDGMKRKIPKKFENIYVFHDKKLTRNEIVEYLDELFEECNLSKPHHCSVTLTNSLKELNYNISFHDYSELDIKEKLIDYGWNFNLVNQAFRVIDMELCNEIGGAYPVSSSKDIAKAMKQMKELAVQGYTQLKVKEYLVKNGAKEPHVNKVLGKIHKVQELHTNARKVQEIKIRKALRLNMIHPSILTHGNYNS